ncbi:SEC-C metal-binding domain-containing protein [Methylobacter sp.]|uniref:YecA family protein n=1 Tax=Methylobacter sp. TaxID=2051955 RepID=UPI001220E6CA|nr:SEC-C metal-binding domain-containing protein [Methylobacter sp.]TAK65073.1 MAG: hypothetical protein EPO18_00880 [Methylobacter sp.]
MPKIGRNNPCPCGSGKKYKRCHGSWESLEQIERETHETMKARTAAKRVQQERQQGLGKPIIAAEAFGQRFVAVKNRLLHSQTWRTFHDFLCDYIKMAIGPDWGNIELAKPLEQRHPILVWYHFICEHQQRFIKEVGKVHSAPMNGAVAAYIQLAYDLYALDHNAELQDKLIGRLRNHDNFPGARYEVYVAATLIRAGFEIEFENEDDRRTSHCEFTATFTRTGKRFSVEAKHRAGYKSRLGQKLNRALAKQANYTRIVFIDINIPDDTIDDEISAHLSTAVTGLRAFEGRTINGHALPNAYLFVTNTPWHHHLELENFRCSSVADGFQIPDFKHDSTFPSLREAIDARERHIEMYELLRSMSDHADIPSTFDGEIPEFAFGEEGLPRLLIGQRYLIKGNDGSERPGLLTTATVAESECTAYCGLSFDDGTSSIYTWPLSDVEMAAWRKHPDTFFGEVGQRTTTANTPLELYDFFLNGFRETPRERLLELMADAPDIGEISKLDQPTLASIFAERCVNGAMLAQSAG